MIDRVRLRDVAEVFNGKTPSKGEQRDSGHPVLKIRDVDEHGQHRRAGLSFVDPRLAAKYRSKWVRLGDTLILNAAHNADYVASKTYFAGDEAVGSMATGEWLLVRPRSGAVHPAFANYWLRSNRTREAIRFLVKGIHLYPKDVAELELFRPPIAEQRRIVDLLARAEGIVRLRREAQEKAAELIPAIFIDMFGNPATNPKQWPVRRFGDVGSLDRGKSRHRPRDASVLYGGPYPFIQTGDVANSAVAYGPTRQPTRPLVWRKASCGRLARCASRLRPTLRRPVCSSLMRASPTAWWDLSRATLCLSNSCKRGLTSCNRCWKRMHRRLRRRTSTSKSYVPFRYQFHPSDCRELSLTELNEC